MSNRNRTDWTDVYRARNNNGLDPNEPSEGSSTSDHTLDQLLQRQFDTRAPHPLFNSRDNLHFPTPSNTDLVTSGPLVGNHHHRIATEDGLEDDEKDPESIPQYQVSCICSENRLNDVMLNCSKCSTFQHGTCVGELNQATDYICHNCRIYRKTYKFYDGWNSYWAHQLKAEFEEKIKGRFDSISMNKWLTDFKRDNNMRSVNIQDRFMEIITKYLREDVYTFNQKLKLAFFSKADARKFPDFMQQMGLAGRYQIDEKKGNILYFSYFDNRENALGKWKNPSKGSKNSSSGAPAGQRNEANGNRKRACPSDDHQQLSCNIKLENRGTPEEASEKLFIPNNSVYYFLFLFLKLLSEQKCNDPHFHRHIKQFREALLENQVRLQKIPLKIDEWNILFETILDNTVNSIRHPDEDVQIVSQADIFLCPKMFLEDVKKMISSFCEHSDRINKLVERIDNEIAEFKGTEKIHSSPIDRTFYDILHKYITF